jgi:hypothetical protein
MMLHHTFVDEIRHDYFEMMFHHVLVIALLVPGYMVNFRRGTVPLLIMMDLPDAVTQFVRCVVESTYTKLTVFGAYSMVFSWIYFRIFALTYFLYKAAWFQPNIFHEKNFKATEVMSLLLTLLLLLNIYWLYLMVSALLKYQNHGVIEEPGDQKKKKN